MDGTGHVLGKTLKSYVMFKVMCVDNRASGEGPCRGTDAPELVIGVEYHVVRVIPVPKHATECFLLREIKGIAFDAKWFARLDGPDEQELHEQHVAKLTTEYVAKYGEPPIMQLDPVAFARVWEGIKSHLGW